MKGKIGAALEFDGRNDKVDVPYSAALNPAQFSFSLWAKPTRGAGTYRSPLACRDDLPGRGYLLYAHSNNKWSFYIGPGSADIVPWVQLDGPTVVLNAWTHLACTYDGTTMRMYVNGADIGTTRTGRLSLNRARPLRIGAGCSELSGKYFFPGLIDDVRIYNRALHPAEVKALATAGE